MNAPSRLILSESDLVSANGKTISRRSIKMIASYRARRDMEANERDGLPSMPFATLYRDHLRNTFGIVRTLVELRRAKAAVLRLPVETQRARQRALRIEKLQHGLGGVGCTSADY